MKHGHGVHCYCQSQADGTMCGKTVQFRVPPMPDSVDPYLDMQRVLVGLGRDR